MFEATVLQERLVRKIGRWFLMAGWQIVSPGRFETSWKNSGQRQRRAQAQARCGKCSTRATGVSLIFPRLPFQPSEMARHSKGIRFGPSIIVAATV